MINVKEFEHFEKKNKVFSLNAISLRFLPQYFQSNGPVVTIKLAYLFRYRRGSRRGKMERIILARIGGGKWGKLLLYPRLAEWLVYSKFLASLMLIYRDTFKTRQRVFSKAFSIRFILRWYTIFDNSDRFFPPYSISECISSFDGKIQSDESAITYMHYTFFLALTEKWNNLRVINICRLIAHCVY